jgi:hypothetical protein
MKSRHTQLNETTTAEHPHTPLLPGLDYVRGYLDLGMAREALLAAKHQLRAPSITQTAFLGAMHAIFKHSKHASVWHNLVKRAHARLDRRAQRSTSHEMLAFLWACKNWKAAARHIPKRFTGPMRFVEMALVIDILINTRRMDDAMALGNKCFRALRHSDCPAEQNLLRGIFNRVYVAYSSRDTDTHSLPA